jgi:cystathionine gamma-synthase
MNHRLHDHPRCRPEDLGRPIPDSPHAVSVCLPAWEDVIGYEEKDSRVHERMQTGYPRFFLHPLVQEVRAGLRRELGRTGEDVLPFPSAEAARECAAFAGAGSRVMESGGIWAVFFPGDLLPRARAYWQHAGRILSSRAAEDWLRDGCLAAPDQALASMMRQRLAGWSGAPESLISLHPSGMAAIFAAFRAATARRPGRRTVMFGFPYTDTLKILEKFGAGVEFFPRGDADDLARLAELLATEEFAAIFCEFPSNPLLQVPDLPALHQLASGAGGPIVVDDTIGTFANVDVLPHVDLVATSLTKAISGEGDVMAGALTANPHGVFGQGLPLSALDEIYAPDLAVLEINSRDFPHRMKEANANAQKLADLLHSHPSIERVYYPGLDPSPVYHALCKPGGGYGAVLSFLPRAAAVNSPRIYETLRISRGISLGTSYSLVSPYVQLAHYLELEWARACGIDPHLLRVAVGNEPWADLQERFRAALDQ